MYRIATTTEYVFNNKCLTYDEAGNIDDEDIFKMDIPNEFYSLSFDIRLK